MARDDVLKWLVVELGSPGQVFENLTSAFEGKGRDIEIFVVFVLKPLKGKIE